jgi:hypothetical protein
MPREKSKKRKVESDEEMADGTQPPPEESPSRTAAARNNAPEPDDNPVDDNLPPFDPRTFQHAAIPAAQHGKLKAITESWDVPNKALDQLAQLVRETAVVFTEIKHAVKDQKNSGVDFDPSVRS